MTRSTGHNIGLPQWGQTCFYDTFGINQSAVLRLNFCSKNPPLRQAEKRKQQAKETPYYGMDSNVFIRKRR
jgi:hypothetical protein